MTTALVSLDTKRAVRQGFMRLAKGLPRAYHYSNAPERVDNPCILNLMRCRKHASLRSLIERG
jgi:hypothetical protein